MLKKILYILLLLVFGVSGYFIGSRDTGSKLGVSGPVSYVPTNSSVTLQTSTTTVLSANAYRQYALITNDSDTVIYLHLNSATTTNNLNEGIRLNANGGQFEITADNLYTGEVSATSSAASKVLNIVEW